MANVSRPMGFRPVKSLMGTVSTGLIRYYVAGVRSSDTTLNHGDIYIGDAVKVTSGLVLPANSGDTIAGVAVALGTTNTTFGVTGYYNPNNLGQRYLAAADAGVVGVVPAEGGLFEVECSLDLDLVPGSFADIAGTDGTSLGANEAHGSRVTGASTETLTTAANNDVMVVEQQTSPANDPTITNGKFIVRFYKTLNALN